MLNTNNYEWCLTNKAKRRNPSRTAPAHGQSETGESGKQALHKQCIVLPGENVSSCLEKTYRLAWKKRIFLAGNWRRMFYLTTKYS